MQEALLRGKGHVGVRGVRVVVPFRVFGVLGQGGRCSGYGVFLYEVHEV